LCHTIIVDEHGKYSAASPDELALVNMAKKYGIEFDKVDKENNIIIHDSTSGNMKVRKFERLHVCEFSSDRKRMSVVVKDEAGKIKLLTKGADSIIELYLNEESKKGKALEYSQKCVDKWSEEGLRTLFIAEKTLSQVEFAEWYTKVKHANLLTENRDEEIEKVDCLIEKNLTLIGSTAIEDKL
jgi:magnesium-transporting ATPase (P-type)